MMRNPTLTLYFARRFAKTAIIIFIVVFVLIAFIDYLELARRAAKRDNFDPLIYLLVSLSRVPTVIERALPFTILFAAMASFVMANRQLELVVARASGLSAWQFVLPAGGVAVIFGIMATTLFNPFATMLKEESVAIFNQLTAGVGVQDIGGATQQKPIWLRQSGLEGSSILGAKNSFNRGLSLVEVTAFVFDPGGRLDKRVDARSAELSGNKWVLHDATVTQTGILPQPVATFDLPTDLAPDQVSQQLADPDTISFWSLPQFIEISNKSGVPSDGYEMRYQSLLAQPLLFLAMVLVAATVSLRFSRSRDLGQVILTGVIVGFVLYVVTELANGLGRSGTVLPAVAAWTPSLVATLASVTVLLYREDG
ncbi:LPS export ABC transporter permease LptG [Kaistia dalseonensis]|uniref:Lipopolysaccharide export system permease protein n=1 Tax=Kaistia dalseonensis TaxID=410840 RepID=A0ABU0H0D2_9HYPH|nr:LPS export ABC transporter permease LptG [Kaistia dalseonensis]MCX5493211.1 LPS export ABC transporter permease LptG [Kaistia dalseonensis]MDQ0435766.1 lipopolysaccharide export system permease protein [Kaistia dalseonensis]